MSGDDALELEGLIIEQHRGGFFSIECKLGAYRRTVRARPSGKLAINRIKLVPGDEVIVEVSPYDPSRGRIVYRLTGSRSARPQTR